MTQYKIEIHSNDSEEASLILQNLSSMVALGTSFLTGGIDESAALFRLETTEFTYDHGDFIDTEGNLLHIHEDTVTHVTWAKTADQEDVEVDVAEWIEKHGVITDAA
jgi:hypothetical protein